MVCPQPSASNHADGTYLKSHWKSRLGGQRFMLLCDCGSDMQSRRQYYIGCETS